MKSDVLIKEFGNEKRWVNYRLVTKENKITKVPYGIDGSRASSTNPDTWGTYEHVSTIDSKVGIVFHDSMVIGIDIDKCLNDGKLLPEYKEQVADLILNASTYTEVSPSGTGLHLYMRITEPYKLIANKKAPYEVYTLGRYFTVTGDAYGLEEDVRTVTPKELEDILAIIGYPWGKSPITPITPIAQTTTPTTPTVSKPGFSSAPANDSIPEGNTDNPIADEEILARMFRAKNGGEVKALYDGDTSAYGGDDSNADMALCSHLAFWAKKDPVMMERLWMMSPLGQREKTQSRQDYRERTIHNAIANTKDVYQEKVKKPRTPAVIAPMPKEVESLDLLFVEVRGNKLYIVNTENIARILRRHEKFKERVRFDEFKNVTEYKDERFGWRDIRDSDAIEVQTAISIEFPQFAKVGKMMVEDAMSLVASENKIDSASDWIKSLKWDGEARLNSWLHFTYNVEDDEYHQSIGSNWFKGLVKRIIHPGCKFDYVLVLEGSQGIKKSTSLSVLGGSWYVETTMSTDSKDFFMQFQGKAIIEFSEGETLSRTEVKRMKAIITTPVDKYRPAYGRFSVDFPRRCVFAMTTNQDEYLKDETGNRRWLPVACVGTANIDWLRDNREQLYAEAYQRVIIDEETTWEFPDDLLAKAQDERRIHDPHEDVIADWYINKLSPIERDMGVTVKQAFDDAYNSKGGYKFDKYTEMQIANMMKNTLKLDKNRKMINGIQSMRWFPSNHTPNDYERQEPITATEKLQAVYQDF